MCIQSDMAEKWLKWDSFCPGSAAWCCDKRVLWRRVANSQPASLFRDFFLPGSNQDRFSPKTLSSWIPNLSSFLCLTVGELCRAWSWKVWCAQKARIYLLCPLTHPHIHLFILNKHLFIINQACGRHWAENSETHMVLSLSKDITYPMMNTDRGTAVRTTILTIGYIIRRQTWKDERKLLDKKTSSMNTEGYLELFKVNGGVGKGVLEKEETAR